MEIERDAQSIAVFVPAPGAEIRNRVWKGSGIVGSEVGDTGRLRVDYEGDRDLFPTYSDRVRRAAERHQAERPSGSHGYPTRASAHVNPDEVIEVGRWRPVEGELEITEPEKLSNWLE